MNRSSNYVTVCSKTNGDQCAFRVSTFFTVEVNVPCKNPSRKHWETLIFELLVLSLTNHDLINISEKIMNSITLLPSSSIQATIHSFVVSKT